MLTPQQVKNHRFQLGSRGTYRAEEVDAFVQELTASFEEAYTQNEALLKKISLLADKVEEYRRDEDTIRSALLVAQRTADQVVREAKEKADACLAGAENRAKALEEEANARSGQVMQEASDRAQTLTREVDARVSAILPGTGRLRFRHPDPEFRWHARSKRHKRCPCRCSGQHNPRWRPKGRHRKRGIHIWFLRPLLPQIRAGVVSLAPFVGVANAPVFSASVPSSFISMSPLMYLLYSASASFTSLMLRAARICFFVSSSTFLF